MSANLGVRAFGIAGLLGVPALTVFLALFAGKPLKYGAVASLTARAMSELASHQEVD